MGQNASRWQKGYCQSHELLNLHNVKLGEVSAIRRQPKSPTKCLSRAAIKRSYFEKTFAATKLKGFVMSHCDIVMPDYKRGFCLNTHVMLVAFLRYTRLHTSLLCM